MWRLARLGYGRRGRRGSTDAKPLGSVSGIGVHGLGWLSKPELLSITLISARLKQRSMPLPPPAAPSPVASAGEKDEDDDDKGLSAVSANSGSNAYEAHRDDGATIDALIGIGSLLGSCAIDIGRRHRRGGLQRRDRWRGRRIEGHLCRPRNTYR